MSAPTTTRVRVSGPAALAASVPSLLGFHPADGDVVLVFTNVGRVVLTIRIDRPAPDQRTAAFAELIDMVLRNAQVTAVSMVAYVDTDRERLALADALEDVVDDRIAVPDIMRVHGDQVWTDSQQPETLPADPLAPANVYVLGGTVEASRDTLLAEVQPLPAQHMPSDDDVLTSTAWAHQLRTAGTRDAYLAVAADLTTAELREARAGLVVAAGLSVGLLRTNSLACLAILNYLIGDGARARIAAEATGSSSPLAHLVLQALQAGMNPDTLRIVLRGA